MAPNVFRILVQSEESNLRVMYKQMKGTTDFVSWPWNSDDTDQYEKMLVLITKFHTFLFQNDALHLV